MKNGIKIPVGLITTICLFSSVAQATETITYTYDARGRLVKVVDYGDSALN
jgi:YD repeat-containing protein